MFIFGGFVYMVVGCTCQWVLIICYGRLREKKNQFASIESSHLSSLLDKVCNL